MKEVKNMEISEGVTYSGATETDGYMDVPHGMGIMKYPDHNVSGMYQDGELNGIAYLNYHDWMYVGIASNGSINGWGMKVDKGKIQFGVFENNELKVNLTPLIEIFWEKILSDCGMLNKSAISVKKNGEIFVGVPQHFLKGKFGFHFLNNGEVFLVACDYNATDRTGKFLHFDLDYNITKGEYKSGELVHEIDDEEFIQACDVFINHAYMDFDIDMNYSPKSFLFGEKKAMHIFEMGKTPDNLIVKANIGKIVGGNRFECQTVDCETTTWFAFPHNEDIEEELLEIMNNDEHPWVPIFNDYRVEFVNNLSNSGSDHLVVYKHKSNWEEDDYYDLDDWYCTDLEELGVDVEEDNDSFDDGIQGMLRLIPDAFEKKSILENQWRSGGWYYTYPSVRDYVYSLASEDDVQNFFGWLFNNPQLNNCFVWSLPYPHRNAFEQFLKLFATID